MRIWVKNPLAVFADQAEGGIGVDGSASEYTSNLIQELRHALQIQRLHYGSAQVSHLDVIRWATEGSANCLGRIDIGKIEVGRQADFAMCKLNNPRFSGAGNPLAAIVLCGAHRADRVMIGGRWPVLDSRIVDFDIQQLMSDYQRCARELSSNF